VRGAAGPSVLTSPSRRTRSVTCCELWIVVRSCWTSFTALPWMPITSSPGFRPMRSAGELTCTCETDVVGTYFGTPRP
jgi:hypothetical protein